MSTLTIRIPESKHMRLRTLAKAKGISVNRLIIETLQRRGASRETFDDLDALAGRWSKSDAEKFAAAVAPFSEIDAALWAEQPKATYRVKRRRARPGR